MATTTTPTPTPGSFFELPSELLSTLVQSFPCREPQIRTLATLVHPRAAPTRNLVIHGAEATGKSAVTARLLAALHEHAQPNADEDPSSAAAVLDYAIVRSAECVTARHLFERAVAAVADAAGAYDGDGTTPLSVPGRCETLAALTVELSRILERHSGNHGNKKDRQVVADRDNEGGSNDGRRRRFVLVFDGIDRQREAPPTLLPALARLSELIPNLTTIFILTSPSSPPLRLPGGSSGGVPTLHFPPYTKAEFLEIATRLVAFRDSDSDSESDPPAPTANTTTTTTLPSLPNTTPQETADLWSRFAAAVHDALIRTAGPRTLPGLLRACRALWPRFTAPVAAGTHRAREFSRLLVAARVLFQDESVLQPGIGGLGLCAARRVAAATISTTAAAAATAVKTTAGTPARYTNTSSTGGTATGAGTGTGASAISAGADLAALLPLTARLLLIAAYLASHNAPRHDQTLFSTWHHQRRRGRRGRKGGGPGSRGGGGGGGGGGGRGGASNRAGTKHQHRRIARKLLGPGAFVLERMVAIYVATRGEWVDDDDGNSSDDEDNNNRRYGGGKAEKTVVDGDVGMAIATLASLRLLVRVGGGSAGGGAGGAGGPGVGSGGADMDRGGKWRVNVGWEVIRALGRSMGVEVEEWLIE
ncbi:hypothetical protein SLS62_005086 [Diatrype stigma]|uniref:Orc1-like AAA ATPase domain-containing protein n=1 Tax=Diatrype stigma TaxID=117547 RepID=A0AAN9YSH7_9PEZI